jgi:AcrR family transcriptional regulator
LKHVKSDHSTSGSKLLEADVDVIQNKNLVEERRDQLLDAAQDLFMEKGFASTTIRDICGRSGVNQASIYDYVLNKHDILRRLLNRIWFQIPPRLEDLLADETRKSLREILKTYYGSCWKKKRNGTILAYRSVHHLNEEDKKQLQNHERAMINALSLYLRSQCNLDKMDQRVEVIANFIIFANAFGPMRDWLHREIESDLVLDTIVDGILAMVDQLPVTKI